MNADLRSVPATALERKIVRALRRLDVGSQVDALAIVTALADGRITSAHVIGATASGSMAIADLAAHCIVTQPRPEVRAA